MTDSFVNNKGSLEERVNLFNKMALPGQPLGMHMGTSYLVNDLMREIQELREALKPFANEAEAWISDIHKDNFVPALDVYGSCCGNCGGDPEYAQAAFSIGDLRRARAKLEGSGA